MATRSKDDFYNKYGNYGGSGEKTEDKPVGKRTKDDFFEVYGSDSSTSEDFRMQAAEAYLKNREKSKAQSRAMNFRYNSEPTFRASYPTALFSEKLYKQAANADKGNNRSMFQTQMDAAKYNALVEKGKRNQNTFTDNKILQDLMRNQTGTEYLNYATDEEKEKFFYLAGKNAGDSAKEQKGDLTETWKERARDPYYSLRKDGGDEAQRYLEELSDTLKQRQLDNTKENVTKFSKEHPIGGVAVNAVMPIISGLGYLEDVGAAVQGKEFNPYSTGHTASAVEQATREGVKQAARENIADSSVTDFLVDTGLSITQSLARLPFGAGGLAIAGASAATQGAEDAVERGATKGQALLSGLAQGAAEAGAEKFSLGSLKSMKQMPVYTAKDIGKNLLKQVGTEASEEMVTEFANTMTDYMIMRDQSNYNRSVSAYMATGATESEAKKLARLDIMKNIGLSGLGGAISGGVMGGGVSALNGIEQYRIGEKSDITNYQEFADTVDTDRESYKKDADYDRAVRLQKLAQEFADREANGEKLSRLEKGAFERDLYEFEAPLFKEKQEKSAQDNPTQEDIEQENIEQEDTRTEIEKAADEALEYEREQSQEILPVQEAEQEDTRTEIEKAADRVLERENREIAPVQEESKVPEKLRKNMEEIAEFGNLLGENGKETFVEQFDNESGILEYRSAFNRYYDAGRHNTELSRVERSAMSAILTDKQAIAAYEAGARDRMLASDALQKEHFTEGEKKTGSAVDLSGRASEAQMNVAGTIGKKTGLRIELIGSDDNMDGSYSPKSGVIQVSVDSDNFLQTASHELTHFIKDYAGDYFEAYKDICINALMSSEKLSYDEMVERYEEKYLESGSAKNREEILEEIAADAAGKFLNDENFINEVKKEDKGLAQKIMDFISDMIDSIKELLSTNKLTKAAEALSDQLDFYENARDMWAHGLEKAGETYKSGMEKDDNNVRYRLNEFGLEEYTEKEKQNLDTERIVICNTTSDIKDFVNSVNSQKLKMLYMGNIGSELSKKIKAKTGVDVEGYSVVLRSDNVTKIKKGHGTTKELLRGQIPVTADIFSKIPEIISKPDRIMVAGETDHGKPALRFEKEIDGNHVVIEYVSDKRRMLYTQTMWVNKTNPPTTNNVHALSLTSETVSGTDSELSINDTRNDVNKENRRLRLKNVDESTDMDSLLTENAELKKANEYLEQQLNSTKDYAPGVADIERISERLLKNYNSKYPKERLNENLKKLYNYIRVSDQIDGVDITKAATAIGKSIVNKSEIKDTALKEQYQELLAHVKNTKMVLPERFRSELEIVGGYSNFRKHYFGKIRLGNEGIDVDVAYQELSSLYPDMFDDSIVNPADQILKIAEVVDSVQPKTMNPYHANMDEMAYLIGQEIFNEYFDVRSLEPTRKDRMDGQVYDLRMKYREHMNAYKARLKAEYEGDLSEAEKAFVRKRLELSRQYNNTPKEDRAALADIRRQLRELEANKDINLEVLAGKMKYQRRRDAAEIRKHKARIIKDVTEMTSWLEKPTDKKHVPEQMRVQLAEFLKGIDFSSDKVRSDGEALNRTKQWHNMQSLFGKIIDEGGLDEGENSYYMEIDPDIVKKMEELHGKITELDKLDDLSIKEIRTLREVVQSVKRCIADANSMYANKNYERIEDVAKAFQSDNANRKDKTEYVGLAGQALRMAQIDMLDANTMFTRMGPAAKTVYQELRDGFDQKIRNTKIAQDYMEKLKEENQITAKDIRAWSGKNAETHEFEVQGQKIKFTTAQVMSLYAQNKREQARGHIYSEVGGIKTAPTVRKDEKTKRYVIDRPTTPIRVTPLDVENITKVLTPEQKKMADGIVKFFTTQTSEWGNEVSMRMYGYKKFMAPNYFPIVTDKNYLATKNADLENTNTTLRNLGATKATVYKANNPIIIEDIFDVYTRQADQMGSYHAFVIPLSDMQKWLNYKQDGVVNVKETLDRVFGSAGQEYIKQLLIDVNGSSKGTTDITAELVRNMKAASVGGNLRTAIQQPTAYMRAMMEIDVKYLAEGLTKPCKDWEMAKQYAPIVQWKDWGYYDINTGRSMKSILMGTESLRENLTEKSMWLAGKGDEVTWKRLWEAVKAETRDLHPELKEGSEEFYTQAGKRLTGIVDNTQVVDSVFHRSQLMKRKDGLAQMYTSFMGEPTKTYNMLYRTIADCAVNKTKKSAKQLGRVAITYAITAATTSAAASFIDAARDDDDEKGYWEKYSDAFAENLIDNLNPLNMVPILRDIWSTFNGYEVKRTDMQAIQQLYYFTQQVEKYAKGESDLTIPGLVLDSSKAISLLTGVPMSNALRDINGVVDSLLRGQNATGIIYHKRKMTRDIKSSGNLSQYIGLAMSAYYKGDKELGDRIVTDLKDSVDLDDFERKYVDALKGDERTVQAAEARGTGKMLQYESLAEELETEGFDKDYVLKAIKGTASGFKSNIKKIKEYRDNGKEEQAEELEAELLEQGFSEAYIDAAIKELPEDEEDEDEPESMYTWSDLDLAFDSSTEDFDRVVECIWEEKKNQDWDDTKIISQARSWFTSKYKELYQYGTDAERMEIRKKLYSLKIKRKKLYDSEKIFSDWMDEKKEKERQEREKARRNE